MADDVLLFKEVLRFFHAEARDGEAVGHAGAFRLEGFDGGEKRETRGDVVFNDEDALALHVAAFDTALVAVGLGGFAHEDRGLVEAIGEGGRVRNAGAFDAGDDVKVELELIDARGHRFDHVVPGVGPGRELAVVDVDRRDEAGLEAKRGVLVEGDRTVGKKTFGEDVFGNLRNVHV